MNEIFYQKTSKFYCKICGGMSVSHIIDVRVRKLKKLIEFHSSLNEDHAAYYEIIRYLPLASICLLEYFFKLSIYAFLLSDKRFLNFLKSNGDQLKKYFISNFKFDANLILKNKINEEKCFSMALNSLKYDHVTQDFAFIECMKLFSNQIGRDKEYELKLSEVKVRLMHKNILSIIKERHFFAHESLVIDPFYYSTPKSDTNTLITGCHIVLDYISGLEKMHNELFNNIFDYDLGKDDLNEMIR